MLDEFEREHRNKVHPLNRPVILAVGSSDAVEHRMRFRRCIPVNDHLIDTEMQPLFPKVAAEAVHVKVFPFILVEPDKPDDMLIVDYVKIEPTPEIGNRRSITGEGEREKTGRPAPQPVYCRFELNSSEVVTHTAMRQIGRTD